MIRIGVDFGGTKIEAAALDAEGRFQARVRAPSPGSYEASLQVVCDLVAEAERQAGAKAARGLMRDANTTHLNDRPFPVDLAQALGRPVRYANDANCLALSEATDGAGAGQAVVYAVILGTGVGAGVAIDGRIIEGRNAFAGEWGHAPLPWPQPDELGGPVCFCGRQGCLELWISGPAFAERHGAGLDAPAIVAAAVAGDPAAQASLARYRDRLVRGLAVVSNILDPDVIVLGGGMSNVDALYDGITPAIGAYVFSDVYETPVVRAAHGDSSGVRGAAWLWPLEPAS